MNTAIIPFMEIAIEQAELSLREGNCGFGAVIIQDDRVVGVARDAEKTQQDPTAHAEMLAIRRAAAELGHDLAGCTIVSTHEPCPMCSTAILWSGIRTVVFGFSIKEALQEGRKRIDLTCEELFRRAGQAATIVGGVQREKCSVLYNKQVRDCLKELRDFDDRKGEQLAARMHDKRQAWYEACRNEFEPDGPLLDRAYRLFLAVLSIRAEEAPVVRRDNSRLVIHSRNFCPTLEACRILGLDTRRVCAKVTEEPMDKLLKQLDPRLAFSRSYETIRPHAPVCEEYISVEE